MPETNRPPFNGGQLFIALPQFRPSHVDIDHWVVGVDMGPEYVGRYVIAMASSLDSPTWGHGDYHRDRNEAIRAAYVRANVHALPWDEISATVR